MRSTSMENAAKNKVEVLVLNEDVLVSVQEKKYVCLQCDSNLHVFRAKNELEACRWFMAFASHGRAGPMMEGKLMMRIRDFLA